MKESFESIEEILNRVLSEDLAPDKIIEKTRNREIIEGWNKVVSPEWAELSRPIRIKNNELIVMVNSPSLLFHMKRFYYQTILNNVKKRWPWIKAIQFKAS